MSIDCVVHMAKRDECISILHIPGQGVVENFFSGGQLKSDETTEDPMEFEKQIWLAETG